MASSKRSASPLEGAVIKSTTKPSSRSSDSTADPIEEPADMPVRIIVSARSGSKAKRNDPASNQNLGRRGNQAKSQTRIASSEDQADPQHSGTSNEDSKLDEETKALSNLAGLPFHDDFAHVKWLEQIDGLAFANSNWIGYCEAKLIRRLQIHHKFWTAMEAPTRGTSELAFELFDRYGRLRKEFQEHRSNKGTGVWGSELGSEDILLIEYIRIEPGHLRQKIGTQIINAILNKARQKSTKFFALAKPRYIMQEELTEVSRPHQMVLATEAAEQFFRSMGFRRVGTSDWFAFTDDPSHPSKKLKTSQELYKHRIQPLRFSIAMFFARLRAPEMVDDECVWLMQTDMRPRMENEPGTPVDDDWNTALHLFALRNWPKSIAYASREWYELTRSRNRAGHTPLEALQNQMEKSRTTRTEGTKTHAVSDDFRGFTPEKIESLAVLQGVTICDLDKVSKDIISRVFTTPKNEFQRIPGAAEIQTTLRLKYGCTCGQCLGGFLSPRMQYALRREGYWQMRALKTKINHGPTWLEHHKSELERVSLRTREIMENYKFIREGFVNLSKHLTTCIDQDRIPDKKNILEICNGSGEWPPVTRLYLGNRGTVDAAITPLFHKAKDRNPWSGDSSRRGAPWTRGDPMTGIVECRNDLEFGFVTEMCGFKRSED
ncbi:hypothetical protein CDV36_014541 [Fusarium kuroshium]|uniref:N-acetyltransferase domain-containing protein n=1 Tax=Fusarium kuroshium TaxID=2010991 RepID=A0A3M2RHJ8_9HYPO|nr:hypothetical protein CDV36_014541 [Fusarium kuroshium]